MPEGRPPTTLSRADALRLDSKLENAFTGSGIAGLDANEATRRVSRSWSIYRSRQEYRDSFAARREIDGPAQAIVSQGIELGDLPESVDPAAVLDYMSAVGVDSMLPEDRGVLQAMSQLYGAQLKLGGSIAVMIIEDGLEPWEPVDFARIQDLIAIEVVERDSVTPWNSDGFGRAEFYVLGNVGGTANVIPGQIVHRSRVIVGVGDRLGPREEALNNGWGASRLELLADERTAMHLGYQELASLTTKSLQDVVMIAELAEMLCETTDAGGTTGKTSVEDRLALIARTRSQHRIIPLDAGREANTTRNEPGRPADKMETLARPLRGAQDLAVAIAEHWAGGTGQTPSIALGLQEGGLNTGANSGDARSYGGKIGGIQTTWLEPRLRIILDVIFAAMLGPTSGRVPEGYSITFPAMWKPTEDEIAATAKTWAEVDTIYFAMDSELGPAILEQRLIQGNTGMLTLEAPEEAEDPPPGEPAPVEEVDELDVAWSDAQPPEDAGTAVELAGHEDLANKISAQGIHALARSEEIPAYKDIRRGKLVAVFSLREVKAALLLRRDPEEEVESVEEADLAESTRADSRPKRRWFSRWRK